MFDFVESFEDSVPVGGSEAVALTERIFSGDGAWLKTRLGMESRPQQTCMALAAARAFAQDSSLLFEAGTGVGKSLAYLLPGLIFSGISGKKFVVSTLTIPLQEQILKKDLPLCRELFSRVPALERFADFKVALMLGKQNYLCGTRLAQALKRHEGLFEGGLDGTSTAAQLMRIRDWAAQPDCTGLREHMPFRVDDDVWDLVNADSAACSAKHCRPDVCAYRRSRAALAEADIVVVNHHLLFSLIGAGAGPNENDPGVLYPNDFVVLDEAHSVPKVATDYFGTEISSTGLFRLLSRIGNACKPNGILHAKNGLRSSPKENAQETLNLAAAAREAAENFFSDLRFRFLEKNQTFRFREPNWAQNVCEMPLGKLEAHLKARAQLETREVAKDEINDFAERLELARLAVRECLELRDAPQSVYWARLNREGRRTITLCGKPLDVAPRLAETLFSRRTSVVLSSATLTDGSSMARFRKLCGADLAAAGTVVSLAESSPFDYAANMEIFIGKNLPEPNRADGALDAAGLADVCAHCIEAMRAGGTLILCTSRDVCRDLAAALRERFRGTGREILVQGEDGRSRATLVRRFAEHGNAVLIGTDSFRTGVDVPGAALSQVILTRLPFENPREPLVEARCEWLAENGKNAFAEMSLPDAVLQFRQGIGRLIRKSDDRGRLVLLDSRLLSKGYGRRFIAALPHAGFKVFSAKNFREEIPPFLG